MTKQVPGVRSGNGGFLQKPEIQKPEQKQPVKSLSDQASERIIRRQHEFEMWRKEETERLETGKQKLRRQTRQIEQERIQLNIEKAHFYRQQEFQETKKKHEEHLLEMKRQILEEELYKLAEEKRQIQAEMKLLLLPMRSRLLQMTDGLLTFPNPLKLILLL